MTCPECQGSGRVSVPFLFFFSKQRPCSYCYGYGSVDDPNADPKPHPAASAAFERLMEFDEPRTVVALMPVPTGPRTSTVLPVVIEQRDSPLDAALAAVGSLFGSRDDDDRSRPNEHYEGSSIDPSPNLDHHDSDSSHDFGGHDDGGSDD